MEFRVDALLERYRKMFSDRASERTRIVEIIHARTGVTIDPKDMTIKKGVLQLSIKSSIMRNELFLRKEKILLGLKEGGFNIGELKM